MTGRRFRSLLPLLVVATMVPAAGAGEPCTDAGGDPRFERRSVWFRDGEVVGNTGGFGLADHVGWGETPPAPRRDPDCVFIHGAAVFGDSGSGVITAEDDAVGILSYLNTLQNGRWSSSPPRC